MPRTLAQCLCEPRPPTPAAESDSVYDALVPLPRRAYIIHVPGDSKREKNVMRLTRSLQTAGVPDVVVFPGIRPPDRGPLYSSGEWGCYQSHVACLRRIADDSDPNGALVLEDDAVLTQVPARLAEVFTSEADWDFLHAGYLSNTVFRDWDEDLMCQNLVRARGVLFGLQCYAARPAGLADRCELLEQLPFVPAAEGGGVGVDGALCELAWRDPSLVRMAPPRSLFRTIPGVASGLRDSSRAARGREIVRSWLSPLARLR